MTTALDLGVNRRSEEKVLQRAGYYSLRQQLRSGPLGHVHRILSTRFCKLPTIGCTFNKVIVSFKSILLPLSNHQCCHFPAIRLNTGIFLDWPIREILSLCFLPNRTKVSLFCYSARYRYPYFQVQIEMANTGDRLFTFPYIMQLLAHASMPFVFLCSPQEVWCLFHQWLIIVIIRKGLWRLTCGFGCPFWVFHNRRGAYRTVYRTRRTIWR